MLKYTGQTARNGSLTGFFNRIILLSEGISYNYFESTPKKSVTLNTHKAKGLTNNATYLGGVGVLAPPPPPPPLQSLMGVVSVSKTVGAILSSMPINKQSLSLRLTALCM